MTPPRPLVLLRRARAPPLSRTRSSSLRAPDARPLQAIPHTASSGFGEALSKSIGADFGRTGDGGLAGIVRSLSARVAADATARAAGADSSAATRDECTSKGRGGGTAPAASASARAHPLLYDGRAKSVSALSTLADRHAFPNLQPQPQRQPQEKQHTQQRFDPEAERLRAEARVRERRAAAEPLAAQHELPLKFERFDAEAERRRAEARLKERKAVAAAAQAAAAAAAAHAAQRGAAIDPEVERQRAESRLRSRRASEAAAAAAAAEEEAARRRARESLHLSAEEARSKTAARLRAAAAAARAASAGGNGGVGAGPALASASAVGIGVGPLQLGTSGSALFGTRARTAVASSAGAPPLSPRSQAAAAAAREAGSRLAAARVQAHAQREAARLAREAAEGLEAAKASKRVRRSALREEREAKALRFRAEVYAINELMRRREELAFQAYQAQLAQRPPDGSLAGAPAAPVGQGDSDGAAATAMVSAVDGAQGRASPVPATGAKPSHAGCKQSPVSTPLRELPALPSTPPLAVHAATKQMAASATASAAGARARRPSAGEAEEDDAQGDGESTARATVRCGACGACFGSDLLLSMHRSLECTAATHPLPDLPQPRRPRRHTDASKSIAARQLPAQVCA